MLVSYNGDDAMGVIRRKYIEKFGNDDHSRASLKLISNKDSFLIVGCSLSCYTHLLETLLFLNDMFTTLNTSGTLKALGSRIDEIKKQFRGTDINTVD